MTHNKFYLYRCDGSCILCHPCFTFDADPQNRSKNQFIQSFLYYVPYVTLAVMTISCDCRGNTEPCMRRRLHSSSVSLQHGFGASLFSGCLWHAVRLFFVIELFFVEFLLPVRNYFHLHLTHSHGSQCSLMAFCGYTCAAGSNDFDRDLRQICLN